MEAGAGAEQSAIGFTGPESEEAAARTRAALAELSQKVVQLTKVIVFLHTRSDGHDQRCAALKSACEGEVRQVADTAAACVEAHRQQVSNASTHREQWRGLREKRHSEMRDAAAASIGCLRRAADSQEAACRRSLGQGDSARIETIAGLRSRVGAIQSELDTFVKRAQSDKHWLARQLAAEAAQERVRMDEAFESEVAALRSAHDEEAAALKAARSTATEALRLANSEKRDAVMAEADQERKGAAARQGDSFEAERRDLDEQVAAGREELAEARAASVTCKEECSAQQRELDGMSRELQEKKRRAHFLSGEADRAHDRRFRAESEARELRRQKAAIERTLGNATVAPQTEKALAGLSEDVRSAQARMQSLRGELARTQRLVEERKAALLERGQRATRLGQELLEERRRADELQRVLLRLERST